MTALSLAGVPIQDSYSETFTATMAAVWITAPVDDIARAAGYETKGLGRSATQPPCEATVARLDVYGGSTPDGRPGIELHLFDRKAKHLQACLATRLRKGTMPYPGTAVFDAMPPDIANGETLDLSDTIVRHFADGFDEEVVETVGGRERTLMVIPRMDGPMNIERTFRTVQATTGGMFLVLGRDKRVLGAAMRATEVADFAVPMVTAKCAASGSKVGAVNLKDMVATTNHRYCPSLRDRIDDSALPPDVECVYEIIVSGPTEAGVREAMAAGIAEAVKYPGVLGIDTANYGGKLGSGKIPLSELL